MKRDGARARKRSGGKAPSQHASEITVHSDITLPPRVLPWERELLLPHVRALLDAVLQSDTADADDKEG